MGSVMGNRSSRGLHRIFDGVLGPGCLDAVGTERKAL